MPIVGQQGTPFDIASAVAANLLGPLPDTRTPVNFTAMASTSIQQGVTTSGPVPITGGPRQIGCFLDASNYITGTNIVCGLQFLFPNEVAWQTVMYFSVSSRGLQIDGVTPASEWGGTFKSPTPIPTGTQSQVVIIQDGQPFVTAASIRF